MSMPWLSLHVYVLLDKYKKVHMYYWYLRCIMLKFIICDKNPWYVFFLQIHDQCSTKWVNHRDSTQKSLSAGYNLTTHLEENSSAWLPMQIGSSRSKKYTPKIKKRRLRNNQWNLRSSTKNPAPIFFLGTSISYDISHVELFAYIPRLLKDFNHELSNVSPPLWAKENASWTWHFSAWFNGGRQPTYPNLPLEN